MLNWLARSSRLLAAAVLMAGAAPLHAQRPSLDVPFVPTNQPTVEAMLRIANVGPNDFVIDLGSGDGRILITAARQRGARGFGVDLDPQRVKESVENARVAGVSDRVQFFQRNLFDTKIAEASVVTMYLLPRVNLDLRPRLLSELKPGTRVVSHDFDMGDWKADLRARVPDVGSEIYFWVIPALVAGRWRAVVAGPQGEQPFELDIIQKYQEINVNTTRGGKAIVLRDARLDGDRILFTLVGEGDFQHRRRYEGRVSGKTIEGTVHGEGTAPRDEHKWRAVWIAP